MDLTDIYGILHPTNTEYRFCSATHRIFFKTDHILGHTANPNKYERVENNFCILSDNHGIKLEINSKTNYRKYKITWRLNKAMYDQQVDKKK
jgi:hypothetical protein